jgi:phosphohistidine phosphatase
MKPKPPVSLADALTPAGDPPAVMRALAKHMKKARLALVGHEPNMGELAAFLIGATTPVPFKKGAVCRIDYEVVPPAGRGQIIWFATPRMLRKLA